LDNCRRSRRPYADPNSDAIATDADTDAVALSDCNAYSDADTDAGTNANSYSDTGANSDAPGFRDISRLEFGFERKYDSHSGRDS
jgi:hypothetical protein